MSLYLDYEIVNVFAQTANAGRPLGIVYIPKEISLSQEQKRRLLQKLDLDTVSFVSKHEDGNRRLLIDTEYVNHDDHSDLFAGHAYIGIAASIGRIPGPSFCFNITDSRTRSSVLGSHAPESGLARTKNLMVPRPLQVYGTVSVDEVSAAQKGLIHHYWDQNRNRTYPLVGYKGGLGFALVDMDTLDALKRVDQPRLDLANPQNVSEEQEWRQYCLGTYYFTLLQTDLTTERVGTLKIRARLVSHDGYEHTGTASAAILLCAYLTIRRREQGNQQAPWKRSTFDGFWMKTIYRYEIVQGVELGRRSTMSVEVMMKGYIGDEIDKIILEGRTVKVTDGKLLFKSN